VQSLAAASNSNYVFNGAAQAHSAVIQNGLLYTFGANTYGQLGQGNTLSNYVVPTLVPGISNAVAVTCGQSFTAVLTSTSNVYAMGLNSYGQLGADPVSVAALCNPTLISTVSNVAAITAGWDFLLCLTTSNVYGFGNNGLGQLGTGATSAINYTPVAMQMPTASNGSSSNIVAGYLPATLEAGAAHACLVLANGMVYLCGDNSSNQLGSSNVTYAATPGLLPSVQQVARAACGTYHTVLATLWGDVYAFGANAYGQLGTSNTSNYQGLSRLVFSGSNLVGSSNVAYASNVGGSYALAAGAGHTVLATNWTACNNAAYSWGDNTYGQLGLGSTSGTFRTPTRMGATQVAQVGAGQYMTVMLLKDTNQFAACGNNAYGQMGDAQAFLPSAPNRYFPNTIALGTTQYPTLLAQGGGVNFYANTMAVTPDGVLWMTGSNGIGQLGIEYSSNQVAQTMTPVSSIENRVRSVVMGGYSHLGAIAAVDVKGSLLMWGNADMYGFGIGPMSTTNTAIAAPRNVNLVSAGDITSNTVVMGAAVTYRTTTYAYDSVGNVYAAGQSAWATSAYTSCNAPVKGTGNPSLSGSLSNASVVSMAAGVHVLALDSLGRVHAWYNYPDGNGYGAAGTGSFPSTGGIAPVCISSNGSLNTAGPIVAIAAGLQHSMALDQFGRVHTWGYNGFGQLGNSNTTNVATPVLISGTYGSLASSNVKVTAIAAGYYHSVALDSTGTVHTWGWNGNGQLGNNATTNSLIPISIATFGSLNGVAATAIAAYSTCTQAVDTSGNIHAWGQNVAGQLGLGSSVPIDSNQLVPAQRTLIWRSPTVATRMLSRGYGRHKMLLPALGLQQYGGNNSNIQAVGDNSYGQLGDGTTTYRFNGALSSGAGGSNAYYSFGADVVATATGLYHSAVVLNGGAVYAWGRNASYECGLASGSNVGTPTQVAALSGFPAADVACATGVTLTLLANGTVMAMGTNATGLLGNGSALGTNTSASGAVVVSSLTNIKTIAAGENSAAALDVNGYLWVWGANAFGQLGTGSASTAVLSPVQVLSSTTGSAPIVDFALGAAHTVVVTASNQAFVAGLNSFGQLGTSNNAGTMTPNATFAAVSVPYAPGAAQPTPVACAAGAHHTVVLLDNGTIRTFGNNDRAQLGLPYCTSNSLQAYPPITLGAAGVTLSNLTYGNGAYSVSQSSGTGYYALAGVPSSNVANAWTPTNASAYSLAAPYAYAAGAYATTDVSGSNYPGEWVQVTLPSAITPSTVQVTPTLQSFANSAPATFSVLGSTDGGSTFASVGTFVGNGSGTAAHGPHLYYPLTSNAYSTYRLVVSSLMGPGGRPYVGNFAVFSGGIYSCTPVKPLKYNRYVTNVGASVNTTYVELVLPRETQTQTATGAYAAVYTKVRSHGALEWASGDDLVVSGPCLNTGIVTKSGQFLNTGYNAMYELGTGSNSSNYTTPNSNMVPYYAGSFFAGAAFGVGVASVLDATGRLFCWGGSNAVGAVGNGTSNSVLTPTVISGAYGSLAAPGTCVVAVAQGGYGTMALDSAGRVHAWGSNVVSTSNFAVPTLISGVYGSLSNAGPVVSISRGTYHWAAVDASGNVHAWGTSTSNGQLGTGSNVASLPVPTILKSGSLGASNAVAVAMSCGPLHNLVLDTEGRVHAWGDNSNGQLANGSINTTVPTPALLTSNMPGYANWCGARMVVVCASGDHPLVSIPGTSGSNYTPNSHMIDSDGNLYGSGNNYRSQLNSSAYPSASNINMGINSVSSSKAVTVGNTPGVPRSASLIVDAGGRFIYYSAGWAAALLAPATGSVFLNFTGQHRCFVQGYNAASLPDIEGLIVCANTNTFITTNDIGGDYKFLTGQNAITTNDALPVVALSTTAKDKTVFGVVSLRTNYDPLPNVEAAAMAALQAKGDQRAEINACGEGALWVCDANGPILAGDFVTTSDVPGYGMLQNETYICNYTVAKSTTDCDFQPADVPVQVLRTDQFGNNVLDPVTGMPVYDDVLDAATGLPVTQPAYRMRWLDTGGAQLSQDAYAAALAAGAVAGSNVFRAAFVGVVYKSG
jgi:alpha-tubulin suppressor-like RCC1 family protein